MAYGFNGTRPGYVPQQQSQSLLGLGGNKQFLGDALNVLGTSLLGLGSGRDDWGLLAMQGLQGRQQDRLANSRQAQQDAQQAQLFEFQKKKFEAEQAAAQKAQEQQQAKIAQFQQIVPTLPANLQPIAQAMGPDFLDQYGKLQVESQFPKPQPSPASVQEYEYAKSQGFTGTIFDYQKAKAEAGRAPSSSQPQFGNTPIYGRDKDGNPVIMRLSADGTTVVSPMPEGVTVAPNTQFIDTGTAFVPMDKRTAAPVGAPVAKDVAGEAGQQVAGKAQAQASIDLPSVENNARLVKRTIQDIIDSPGREAGTGLSSLFNPLAVPGSDRANFLSAQDQLKGQTFLAAYESLKGGGQITEVEGAKAEKAKARLQTAQSEEEYLKSLKAFSKEVDNLVEIARKKAQGGAPSAPTVIKYDAQGNRIQ